MKDKAEMTNRKKGAIVLSACIIVIAMLLAVLAIRSVLAGNGDGDVQRETERIKADTHAQTEATIEGNGASETTKAPDADPAEDQADEIDVENNKVIPIEKAKEIALADAGYRESQVTMSRVRYEWDDGIQVYDVEFYYGGLEYEYSIDAKTGKILEKDIDD